MATYQGAHTGAEVDDAVGVVKGSGTGLVVKTNTGAGTRRSIAGTTDEITVTNGDGVSGNPTLALASAVTTSLGLADSAVQPGDLATVATSGDYDDLTNKPDLSTYVESDPTGVTGADAVTNIMSLTQAEYDAIVSPDAATLYIITDA